MSGRRPYLRQMLAAGCEPIISASRRGTGDSWSMTVLTRHRWQVSLTGRGHGFSLVGFETNTQGVALGTTGYLWITRNAGTGLLR